MKDYYVAIAQMELFGLVVSKFRRDVDKHPEKFRLSVLGTSFACKDVSVPPLQQRRSDVR